MWKRAVRFTIRVSSGLLHPVIQWSPLLDSIEFSSDIGPDPSRANDIFLIPSKGGVSSLTRVHGSLRCFSSLNKSMDKKLAKILADFRRREHILEDGY